MSVSRLLKILVLSLALVNVVMAARTPAAIEKEIGTKVICMCGCRSALNDCPDQPCAIEAEMHKMIKPRNRRKY